MTGWVLGIVMHRELCKKLKFDHTNKWHMRNSESVLENETHTLLWDFDIQTDHLIMARRPDLIIINKNRENLQNCGLCCPRGPQRKKWKTAKREIMWNMEVTIIPIMIGALSTVTKGLVQGLENLEIIGREETVHTTTLLRSARILKRVLETCVDLLSLKLQWKAIG